MGILDILSDPQNRRIMGASFIDAVNMSRGGMGGAVNQVIQQNQQRQMQMRRMQMAESQHEAMLASKDMERNKLQQRMEQESAYLDTLGPEDRIKAEAVGVSNYAANAMSQGQQIRKDANGYSYYQNANTGEWERTFPNVVKEKKGPLVQIGAGSVTTNPDGSLNIPMGSPIPGAGGESSELTGVETMGKTGMNKAAEAALKNDKRLFQLREIGESYNSESLTWPGRMVGWTYALRSKSGIPQFALDQDEKDFVNQTQTMMTNVRQFFHEYKKDITGAAAAEKEIKALEEAVISHNISPAEFEPRFRALVKSIEADISRNIMASFGHTPTTEFNKGMPTLQEQDPNAQPQWDKELDDIFSRSQ